MSRKNRIDTKNRQRLLFESKSLFIQELSKQLNLLQQWTQHFENDASVEAAMEIYRIVHTLKGSAPMFGFERIGNVAEALVNVWEWTQLDSPEERSLFLHRIEPMLRKTEQLLLSLTMEYEISCQEIELDNNRHFSLAEEESFVYGRILLIDDDDLLRSYLVRRLSLDHYDITEASCVQDAKRLLWENSYDLIILDLLMHPESGYTLFEFLKESPTLKWVPLIVLSGKEELDDKIRCFKLGADDYVTKPFHYEELEARINNLLTRAKHFEQMAFLDPLTGVYNRRYFMNQLNVELDRTKAGAIPLTLAFVDVDHFKKVNDQHGHHVGDLVLQGLTHLMTKTFRSVDLVARFGGEEFVVLFPNTTGQQAKEMLDGLLQTVRTQPIVSVEGEEYRITFSAGVVEWCEEWEAEQWINLTDHAMYRAKKTGRNQVLLLDRFNMQEIALTTEETAVRKRVLLADDDAIIRSMVVSQLTKNLQIDIVEVADGQAAYEYLQQHAVDLCILDGIMPRLDGFGLLEILKQHPQLKDVKVLMLSGRKQEEDVVRGLMLGADDYMAKPFSLVELEIRAKRLLS